jgi:hypothetical protein
MDNESILERLEALIERLNEAQKVLYKQAYEKAESERVYRSELAQQIVLLRAEGHPVALVGDLARGSVSDEKFRRDLAESRFRATVEAIETIKVQISALQTIFRHHE